MKQNILRGLITLMMSLLTLGSFSCDNSVTSEISGSLHETSMQDNQTTNDPSNTDSPETGSQDSESALDNDAQAATQAYSPESRSLLRLSAASLQGEDLDVLQAKFVIASVEVRVSHEDPWQTISNYDAAGHVYEITPGVESTYLLDSFIVSAGKYTQARIRLVDNQSQVLVQDKNGSAWHGLANSSGEHSGLKIKHAFNIESRKMTQVTFDIELEKKDREHDRDHDGKEYKHEKGNDKHADKKITDYLVKAEIEYAGSKITPWLLWGLQNSGTTNPLRGVTSNALESVAVGFAGTIISSNNGINWITEKSPVTYTLNGITGNGSNYIAVGDLGTILYSTGASGSMMWYYVKTGLRSGSINFNSVAFNGNLFVAVGDQGIIVYSKDGLTWMSIYSGTKNILRGITWAGTQFVAVGDNGTLLLSSDGTKWVVSKLPITDSLYAAAGNTQSIVAVGLNGQILVSTDQGVSFTSLVSPVTSTINAVTWNGVRYLGM